MSPFSCLFQNLRRRHGVRQAELAALLGYEQSYISALELGTKGPPTSDFIEKLAVVLKLSEAEHQQFRDATTASQRKLIVDPDAPEEVFLLLNDLREKLNGLNARQVSIIRNVLSLAEISPPGEVGRFGRLRRRTREAIAM